MDELATLVTQDPVRARVEIRKHLDGDLELVPGPERQIELRGRVKPTSLLVAQEAVGGFSPGFGCGGGAMDGGRTTPLPGRPHAAPYHARGMSTAPVTAASACYAARPYAFSLGSDSTQASDGLACGYARSRAAPSLFPRGWTISPETRARRQRAAQRAAQTREAHSQPLRRAGTSPEPRCDPVSSIGMGRRLGRRAWS